MSSAHGVIGPTGVDEVARAVLTFPSGVTADVTSAIHDEEVGTRAVVFGERGKIVLPNPWIPRGARQGTAIEAEVVTESLPALEPKWPAMSHADTMGNMRVLDAWRAAITRRRREGLTPSRQDRQDG